MRKKRFSEEQISEILPAFRRVRSNVGRASMGGWRSARRAGSRSLSGRTAGERTRSRT